MAGKRNVKVPMKPLDDLFGSSATGADGEVQVALESLHPFKNHPFRVNDDEEMAALTESVRESGVIVPGIVRMRDEGGYELIAGHRRKRACELAGLPTMPVLIRELTDDEATIVMVNSNIQREKLLFSEKAFAYRMRNEAMKRKAGRPSDNSGQVGPNLWTSGILAKETGESANQVKRFIRLTYLKGMLLELTDQRKLPFNTAVELSYLPEEEQDLLMDYMEKHDMVPSLAQAQQMKQVFREGGLTYQKIDEICAQKKPDKRKIQLPSKKLQQYFPEEYSVEQMEEIIYGLLKRWSEERRGQA